MSAWARRCAWLVLVVLVVCAVLSTPVAAHQGHAGHENQQDDDLSIWPLFVVFGTVSAGGTLLASQRLDVPREIAVGLAAGGIAIAVGAAIVWLT
ncbi:hypothetical protein [Salinarchaeum laminariae]|uniref:hypothetical protein n=1 Tax=Salinarchaeum laminariae TaxID=869888 RepID=UPI0020BF9A3A|nr:hypothetical protein [Salinarchaeum laminariae]